MWAFGSANYGQQISRASLRHCVLPSSSSTYRTYFLIEKQRAFSRTLLRSRVARLVLNSLKHSKAPSIDDGGLLHRRAVYLYYYNYVIYHNTVQTHTVSALTIKPY